MVTFKVKDERDSFGDTKQRRSRKQSQGSDSVVKRMERKFHGSFYEIQEQKIKQMHERYQNRAQEATEKLAEQEDEKFNYRSHT
jgi:hypothetical protein